jgi:uncharacterized protein (DUF983 family)
MPSVLKKAMKASVSDPIEPLQRVVRCKQCGQAHGHALREHHQPRVIVIFAVCVPTAAYGPTSPIFTYPTTSMIFIASYTVGEGLTYLMISELCHEID